MKVRNVSGMSVERGSGSADALVPGTVVTAARQHVFQSRMASVRTRQTDPGVNQPRADAPRHLAGTTTVKSSPRIGQATNTGQTQFLRRGAKPGLADIQSRPCRQLAMARAIRRYEKVTPKKVRDAIKRLTTSHGLTLIDIWCDPDEKSVTLVVDKEGWSEMQFIVAQEASQWCVSIFASADADVEALLREEASLQAGFKAADLGSVDLVPGPCVTGPTALEPKR